MADVARSERLDDEDPTVVARLTELGRNRYGAAKGSPNHSPEFRRRLAAAACEPRVFVSKLAREHGINANMLFRWRRRYRAEQQAETTELVPVTVVSEPPGIVAPTVSVEQEKVKPTATIGTIEVRIGGGG